MEPPREPEKICFLGWRRDLGDMIAEFDAYVVPGSTLTIIALDKIDERKAILEEDGRDLSMLRNTTIHHLEGSPVSRRSLLECNIHQYDSILILSEKKYEDDIQKSDSRTLASLILIRDLQNKFGNTQKKGTVISEILDSQVTPSIATSFSMKGLFDHFACVRSVLIGIYVVQS
jgi:hypothetical protein